MSKIPWESFRKDGFNAPNVISSLRILAFWIPAYLLVFGWFGFLSVSGQRWAAVISFAVLAATDFVDGWLARRFDLGSEWGAFIDPIGDKLLVAATLIALCVVYFGQPLWWVVFGSCVFFVTRELILTIQIGRANEKPQKAKQSGRVKTTLQMAMIIAWMMPLTSLWVWLAILLTAAAWVSTITSWVDYHRAFVRKVSP